MAQKRILIVDDDTDLIEVLRLWFTKANFSVRVASDGQNALRILGGEGEAPDVILTDFMMPELNGIELVRALRENDQFFHIPIVVMSNNTSPEFRRRAIELGAAAYFFKPDGARVISEKVVQLLESRDPGITIPAKSPPAAMVRLMRQSLLDIIRLTTQSEGLPEQARNGLITAERLLVCLFAAVPEPE